MSVTLKIVSNHEVFDLSHEDFVTYNDSWIDPIAIDSHWQVLNYTRESHAIFVTSISLLHCNFPYKLVNYIDN